jgi:molybdate transport system substrate-binding protein
VSRKILCAGATVASATLALLVLVGCSAQAESEEPRLNVFAAASLTEVFPQVDPAPAYNFAGSNTLLEQLRQGAPADVFASASPKQSQAAYDEGLCERPVTFATNLLVLVVPKSNPAGIRSVSDLERPGTKIVVAAEGVPVGDYTRTILENLGLSEPVLANVVSNEPDVKSVVGKVALGEADAGFAYRTDVAPVQDEVAVVALPREAQPPVEYQVCVVASSSNKAAARQFVERVLGPIGRGHLSGALFGLPSEQ